MNILYAPNNIASMPSITAEAMNKIPGIKARYISTHPHKYLQENRYMINMSYNLKPKVDANPVSKLFFLIVNNLFVKPYKLFVLCRWIMWADVVHWTWDTMMTGNFDLKLVKFLKKKRFIEWVGSEIRIPEITMKESKSYKDVFNNGYEYKAMESKQRSYLLQEKFASLGFVPILVPEMQLFLKPGLFKTFFSTQYRVFQSEKFPQILLPKIKSGKVVIVHSPSAKFAKGSNIIIPIVEKLKNSFDIEFILLHNVSREEVINTMKRCDIFIDQIILGSYAAAAIEAMSFGKPVMAYIMPQVYKQGTPIDCPVINVNPQTLEEKLVEYISNPKLRNETGLRSRRFVEEVHDADKLALDLLKIYRLPIY